MKTWGKWICVLIFVAIIGLCTYSTFILSILMKYALKIISLLGVTLIVYFFFSDVIFQKCKKCKKLKCFLCSCLIAIICIFSYVQIHKPPTHIQMKEDIVYKHPKSPIDTNIYNPDKIFDGSKNDPNLKDDEGTVKMKEDMLYVHPKKDTIKRK